MIYHVPGMTPESELVEFNFFKHASRTKRSYTVDFVEKSAPRIFPLTRETTILDVKRTVLERMRGVFNSAPEDDEQLNQLVEVHVRENLPMVKKGTYTRTRADCEFCGHKHGYRDEFCDLKLDDVEVNETVQNAS
mmetsp:Transcript_23056/g.28605  ORF Transcript_23056/g.28605 Transcript_23056/m.28605 type:complete len:135 (+) Transcript_23056:469-873(+)